MLTALNHENIGVSAVHPGKTAALTALSRINSGVNGVETAKKRR